ncbi:MAG: VCBS repeat-containing protein [Maribacter sp.]|nr:VCBS repeat-containing protein [Maribacter sp.]
MKKFIILLAPIALIILSCQRNESKDNSSSTEKSSSSESTPKVFERISSEQSNLVFSNIITENIGTLENLFNFDYFYNGAGVGLEDINNDGLLDVFFTGNQVANKLYLNEGDLKFKDISEEAGINIGKKWSNGITFVDINNDGYMDIYVSQGGPNTRFNRKNLLFINNGNLTFSEKAEEYGLADLGISTQSAFFDMDNDGDLDCFVMNENELYGVDPINLYRMVNKNAESQYFNSSHLYRNDNGKFVDISKKAGIQRPIFGLGLCISDINKDGWLDIYVASDYYIPDALFINNGNSTFTDQIKDFTQHTSYFGMGMDIADINNDNLQDIFVLDMSSTDHVRSKTLMASMSTDRFDYLVNKADFHYQYMFNSLQMNIGNDRFNDIAQLTETANTDWSWSVLMSDFDNDQDADIFITNGYRRYALDNDLQIKVFEAKRKYGSNMPLQIKKDLYNQMPSEKLQNILFQNNTDLNFEENAKEWGLDDFSFSNGAAQGDLDNDGDLDLIVNNMDENAFLYKNLTSDNKKANYLKIKTIGVNSEPFAQVRISYNGKSQLIEQKRTRGYRSSHSNIINFGLGENTMIDTVLITWIDGRVEEKLNVAANSVVEFDIKNAKVAGVNTDIPKSSIFEKLAIIDLGIDFVHTENIFDDFDTEVLLPYKQSTSGPLMSKGDVNGDGKMDIYIGGASGQSGQLYIQGNNRFIKSKSKTFEEDKGYEDMQSVFFDFDNDQDLDLYVVSGGNEFAEHSSFYADRIYLNNGQGIFSKFNSQVLTSFAKSGKAVSIIDFDKDGDSDILVGNRNIPKKYPIHSSSILYENTGGDIKDVTKSIVPQLLDFGIINDIVITDFDQDGWDDFIAVGEWTPIGLFSNQNGKSFEQKDLQGINDKGWWFSINETDINNDGFKDYVVGNVGMNIKLKATREKPLKIYANDFDDNGINDVVLSKKYKGEYVPVRGRECSSQQMPFIKDKFGTYSEFANATLADIYGDKLSKSYRNEANELNSILIMNDGNGNFEKKILPIQAQQFPIMNGVFLDLNNDGYEDCIIAGNIYETEVETTRLDAISGTVLISNGKDGYKALSNKETGLYLNDNVKDIGLINLGNSSILINSVNNNRLTAHKIDAIKQ